MGVSKTFLLFLLKSCCCNISNGKPRSKFAKKKRGGKILWKFYVTTREKREDLLKGLKVELAEAVKGKEKILLEVLRFCFERHDNLDKELES